MAQGGAYLLFLSVSRAVRIRPGRLGPQRLEAGRYVYVGSARRHLVQRVARHRQLATGKTGNRHWHIDALLLHGWSRWDGCELFVDDEECRLSHRLATLGAETPLPGFGATDCRAGCRSHLYRVARWPQREELIA